MMLSQILRRKGLAESLEAYAARCGVKPHEARTSWRIFGLGFLGVDPDAALERVAFDGPRIAPDVRIRTKPTWWETERVAPKAVAAA